MRSERLAESSGPSVFKILNTAMHRAAEPDEDPGQWADPADVTEVFIYLASDESTGVSGRRFEAQKFNHGRAESHHVSGS